MKSILFEWDDEKNKGNKRKHGIGFDEAATVFFDEFALVFDDPDHSDEEERFLIIGISCFSARKATKAERAVYNRHLN